MARDVRRIVGENVRRLRVAAGLSQADLAERMGVDRSYISGLELGELQRVVRPALARRVDVPEVPRVVEAVGLDRGGGLRRRGAEEAGAIFVKVSRLDGTADLYGPAPQSVFDEARPSERAFSPALKGMPLPEADVEGYLARQVRFDPDLWIVEVEDRGGRHFLDHLVR